jgi:hypothetical protein
MLWQALAGFHFRMPEGYAYVPWPPRGTGLAPPPSAAQSVMIAIQSGQRKPDLTPVLRHQIAVELRSWRVRAVIVGPMAHQHEMVALFRAVCGGVPAHDRGVYVWWGCEKAAL